MQTAVAKPKVKKRKWLVLEVYTVTDKTGAVRGTLYLPGLEELVVCDGVDRLRVVKSLTLAGLRWLINARRRGRVVDCGEEP